MCSAKTGGRAGFVGFHLFHQSFSCIRVDAGKVSSTDLFSMATGSSVTSLSCTALLKILATMLFAKDCAGLWMLACMKTSAICSLMTVNL